jgi:hypothetical protein
METALAGLQMRARFIGGPYDGIDLDHNDINLYTQFLPIGIRQFVVMPPKSDWDAVRRGELGKEGPFVGDCTTYELVRTSQGIEGRYDADGSIFAEALREFNEGRQSVPHIEFTGQYFKCYRGDLRDVSLPESHFTVADEKGRKWECMSVSKEEGERGGFGEMLSMMGGEPLSEPLRMVILHCNNKAELPSKLTDQID